MMDQWRSLKKGNAMKKMYRIILLIICILTCMCIGKHLFEHYIYSQEPILRVITKIQTVFVQRKRVVYYNVYKMGYIKEVEEFSEPPEPETHLIYLEGESTGEKANEEIPIIADNGEDLTPLVKKIRQHFKIANRGYSPYTLFLIKGRYFVVAFGPGFYKRGDVIYEYFPQKDELKQLAKFDGCEIYGIEVLEKP